MAERDSDKRKHIRISLDDTVEYILPEGSFKAKALNISYKGMQIEAPVAFVPGDAAEVVFNLPDTGKKVRIPCTFAHGSRKTPQKTGGVFAVRFERKSREIEQIIWDCVKAAKERSVSKDFEAEESRGFPRVNCLIVPTGDELLGIKVDRIGNISNSGLFIHFEGESPPSGKIPLRFNLPEDKRPLMLVGEVAYITDEISADGRYAKGAGIRFIDISPIDRKRIENFIFRQISGIAAKKLHDGINNVAGKEGFSFTNADKIKHILDRVQKDKVAVNMLFKNTLKSFNALLKHTGEEKFSIDASRLPEEISVERDESVYFSFDYGMGSYYFNVTVRAASKNEITFHLPAAINHSEKRSAGRDAVSGTDEPIVVEIKTQELEESMFKGEIVDISPRGFSFKMPEDMLPHGVIVPGKSITSHMATKGNDGSRTVGEVKYVSNYDEQHGSKKYVKVGVELGVERKGCIVNAISDAEWETDNCFPEGEKVAHSGLVSPRAKKYFKKIVKYRNSKGQHITAYVDSTSKGKKMPVVVLPPAYGKKKETLSPLVMTILHNFRAMGKDVAVVRYDGINRPGESFKDKRLKKRGWEMLNYTITQGTEDLKTTFEYISDNPYFKPSNMAVISFSLASLKARKLLTGKAGKKIGLWLCVMGVADGQSTFRNVSGGLDIVGNYKMGVPNGISAVMGHLIDMDKLARDMIDHKYAYLSDARIDMGLINVPVVWMYGKYDSWINSEYIKDIMTISSRGKRELVEIPTGHNLRTSTDALRSFRLLTAYLYKAFCEGAIIPEEPAQEVIVDIITEERERLATDEDIDIYDYWKNYLMGSDPTSFGYDFLKNLPEFRDFLTDEANLLEIKDGQLIADLGCGTGIFMENLFKNILSGKEGLKSPLKIVMVDFIQEALAKCRMKYERMKKIYGGRLPDIEFKQMNLEGNRLIPVMKFLKDEYLSVFDLKGKIEGFRGSLIRKIAANYDAGIEKILKGAAISPALLKKLKKNYSDEYIECIKEFNLAARFVSRKLKHSDFKKGSAAAKRKKIDYNQIKSSDLNFKKLKFHDCGLKIGTSFKDASFDSVLMGLLVSYFLNPLESIKEVRQMLKPGGRIVVSSMKPDPDISRIFTKYVESVESSSAAETEITDKDMNLAGARSMLNEVAGLFELEEEGYFRFFPKEELISMLETAGFSDIKIVDSLGIPPQAYILTGIK